MNLRKFTSRHLLLLSAGVCFLLAGAALAQEPATPAPIARQETLWQKIKAGGIVMPFLGLFSIGMVWLIIDGVQRSSLKRMVPPDELEKLRNFFRAGDYVGAYQSCKDNPAPINNVVAAGLINVGDGKVATEDAIVAEVSREQARNGTRLSYLSVIGVCTPMVGLLGTVIGMIKAFDELGMQVTANPAGLSEAIGEVLVATASGLFVAIPAFMGFYFLRNRLQGSIHELESEVAHLFRKYPYHLAEGVHLGDQELYANAPNWNEAAAEGAHAQA